MRAVIVETPGDVDALTLGEAPTPTPGPGEVLVRTVASGVNRADVLPPEQMPEALHDRLLESARQGGELFGL